MKNVSRLAAVLSLSVFSAVANGEETEAVAPREVVRPCNGKDLSGLTTWLKGSGRKDPDGVFSVKDGVLHISGQGAGYLATDRPYKDYHLSVEYNWGEKHDGSGNVRNSGILLHALGEGGNVGGVWMTSIECQLAQGCEGDLIVIRGKDKEGKTIPATITCDTTVGSDGRTRWDPQGKKTVYSGKQFWWSKHEPGFKEKLDTRGRDDAASPVGEWTKVECICRGDRITIKINGQAVNECYDVFPAAGKILLQNEGNEIMFRNWELRPVESK
ncbi:MAG: DUF1080 domain-containing protein [Planctomycetia bacterium]|nr:DUF1080 domain-containing protein [Planctomycetia bacterium]